MTLSSRLSACIAALMIAAAPAAAHDPSGIDPATIAAIEAAAYDYVDGQLEGNPARVARSVHPDIAKRAARPAGKGADEVYPLRRMTRDELLDLTHQGALKTPKEQWSRSVKVLDVTGNSAVARVETPWFVDYFHLGRYGDRWMIINALWEPKQSSQAGQ